jgi:hypothetical protein
MRYLGEDEPIDVMGIGSPGEIREGPDGQLYQWVEMVDGLGNPIGGFWSSLKKIAKKALPVVAPYIPGGAALTTGLKVMSALRGRRRPRRRRPARRYARRRRMYRWPGFAGDNGMGALYEAPDGMVYQVQGLGQDEFDLDGLGEDEPIDVMGIGSPGEVREGPDGQLYQWVETVDGLGNPIGGFWSSLKKIAKRALPVVAPYIPGGAALTTGLKVMGALRGRGRSRRRRPVRRYAGRRRPYRRYRRPYGRAGVAGGDGLGALYEAPDGTMYQVQGLGEKEELYGLAEDEELYGFGEDEDLDELGEDEELYGLAEDEELYGFGEDEDLDELGEDEELYGLSEDEELYGLAQEEELYGLSEDEDLYGYVKQDGPNLGAFIKDKPPATPMFKRPDQAPEIWRPLW